MTFEIVRNITPIQKVLIVDDNFTHRKLLGEIFHTNEGITADFAGNGVEAVQAFTAAREAGEPYNLIMIDEVMPIMTGIEATRTIRALERQWAVIPTAETPIVFVSSQIHPTGVIEAYRHGATDYITKPIQVSRIKQIIRRFLIEHKHIEEEAENFLAEHSRRNRRACLRSLTEVFNNRKH